MELMQAILSRRSVRSYNGKPVPKDLILRLITAARAAPSGGNCQPWHFYVAEEEGTRAEIVKRSCRQRWMLSAPVFIVVCADIPLTEDYYGERGRHLYALQDTAAAIQNILLCAEDLGLSACWCGAFDEEELRRILHVGKDMRPVAIIPVGYSDGKAEMPERRAVEEIVTFL